MRGPWLSQPGHSPSIQLRSGPTAGLPRHLTAIRSGGVLGAGVPREEGRRARCSENGARTKASEATPGQQTTICPALIASRAARRPPPPPPAPYRWATPGPFIHCFPKKRKPSLPRGSGQACCHPGRALSRPALREALTCLPQQTGFGEESSSSSPAAGSTQNRKFPSSAEQCGFQPPPRIHQPPEPCLVLFLGD